MSVPIWKKIIVWLLPSDAVELIVSTPLIVRSEASIFCVICVSISVGAAPGWLITTMAAGNSISGMFCTFICMKETMPTSNSPRNSMIGTTGVRIDQAEILRKFMVQLCPVPVTV